MHSLTLCVLSALKVLQWTVRANRRLAKDTRDLGRKFRDS